MTALFISDVHLRNGTDPKTLKVIQFLREKMPSFQKLFILGDLFDVWPGTSKFLCEIYDPVLEVLREWIRAGKEIHYVEGNHDFRLGKFFSEQLSVQVHPNEHVENWGSLKIYMAHGDLANPAQRSYRLLRILLRLDILHWTLKLLPARFVYQAGLSSSRFSRAVQGYDEAPMNADKIRAIYRSTADRLFEQGYDVVLMGHTHIPDDYRVTVNGRSCRYLNTGDWVRNFSYLEFDGSNFYTKKHSLI